MQGQLFTQDFLQRGIFETPPCEALTSEKYAAFRAELAGIYGPLAAASSINEAQTEQLVIDKVLAALGWGDDHLPQVNASGRGREEVPDALLFPSAQAKQAALLEPKDERRYRHGIAILEAKRWGRALDRGEAGNATDPGAPSSQMLRYLSRAEVVSERAVKWGMLTNGAVWRLYWQDAHPRTEKFFEIDVAAALGLPGVASDPDAPAPEHALALFFLFFCRAAFLPQDWDADNRSFHAYALNEARRYEEKVAQDLGARVFSEIFPQLAAALAKGDLQAQTEEAEADQVDGVNQAGSTQLRRYTRPYLDETREAALILLYRLLFLFYAEDRSLLPVRDPRYAAYSVRRLRERVRDEVDANQTFSSTIGSIWRDLQGVFQLVNEGDDQVGMPAYNGGLFDRARAPLLERTRVPDAVMAPIIDALSRRTEDVQKHWINYRDLSVSHLGSIYERLLEYTLEHEVAAGDAAHPSINRIHARPASFARKVSGSYYTHDDLVRLILRESVGLTAHERRDSFSRHIERLKKRHAINHAEWEAIDQADPASALLKLTVCDPAMGSGHFLVALVDDLAERILEAIDSAEQLVNEQAWAAHWVEQNRPWQSPLVARIAAIRRSIKLEAQEHGWAVSDAQLDDRHIVRRMVLKKNIFGVDKNPMAVELAKTALWLHTFTVGAPLSFLDHHLKCGDSLHGERLIDIQRGLQDIGLLLGSGDFDQLALAAGNLAQVAELTDVDIDEARLSKKLAAEADEQMAPLTAMLDFWRALRWLLPAWPRFKLKDAKQRSPHEDALSELTSGRHDLMALLSSGLRIEGGGPQVAAANALLTEARQLAARERFFHWWTAFPTVFGVNGNGSGGFDVVLGNPPWDRIKLQQVEWFAERDLAIAAQPRAADRKKMIAALERTRRGPAPLWREYQNAMAAAEANARVLAKSGDYPLLGGGDVNLYSLFVERAQALAAPAGLVALLTPSGIAADKGAAEFFQGISATGRLSALFDFENRQNPGGSYFPDVDSRFKFSTLVFGGVARNFPASRCAFYLHDIKEAADPQRVLQLSAADFSLVNPNTGAAPIFKNRRDADITMRLYRENPVLVDRRGGAEKRAWPVKYSTMFHMTNDSGLFLTRAELEKQGYAPAALNRWVKGGGRQEAVPLYEGKMVQMYDHRAADVVVNAGNLHRAAQPETLQAALKEKPDRYPAPQFWVLKSDTHANPFDWALGFKEITAPTNMRTLIAAIAPAVGFGNKLPLLLPQSSNPQHAATTVSLLLANLNSLIFDFVLRQKIQGQTINLFILEQLPVIAPHRFEEPLPPAFAAAQRKAGLMNGHHPQPTVADFVIPQVLALSYTAHDLAPFARDLGYVDAAGSPLPPFVWNAAERRQRMNALDALFMHLYGLSALDAAYILEAFPIVREQDIAACGSYRTQALILEQLRLLQPDAA